MLSSILFSEGETEREREKNNSLIFLSIIQLNENFYQISQSNQNRVMTTLVRVPTHQHERQLIMKLMKEKTFIIIKLAILI